MKKLMIISGSKRVRKDPKTPIPAIERFDGGFAKQIRAYYKSLHEVDIVFISPTYGVVGAEEKIGFKESIGWDWRHLYMNTEDSEKLKKANSRNIEEKLSQVKYSEVYINVGKELLKLIPDLEELIPEKTRITYAKGAMGQKMAHMKKWVDLQLSTK